MQKFLAVQPRGEMTTAWWISVTAIWIITVATVVGNLAVLIALRRVHRAPAHYPLASLACADLLVGLLVLPLAGVRELFALNLDKVICSCWNTFDVLCCTASILSICLLGWERWCGITAPFARAKRARQARLYAALVWPVSIIVALPTAFIPSYKTHLPGEIPKACSVNTNIAYVLFSITLSFYIPASIMLYLYARILRALAAPPAVRAHCGGSPRVVIPTTMMRRNVCAVHAVSLYRAGGGCKLGIGVRLDSLPLNSYNLYIINNSDSDLKIYVLINTENTRELNRREMYKLTTMVKSSDERDESKIMLETRTGDNLNLPEPSIPKSPLSTMFVKTGSPECIVSRQRRATRTIVMLMSLFLFCWTPFFVMLPLDSICDCVRDSSWQWCTWLGYANSALNPFVYAASSPAVGRALQASLTSTSGTRTAE